MTAAALPRRLSLAPDGFFASLRPGFRGPFSCHAAAMANRSVLISGASTGIGEACALRLADRGWQVFAGVRRDAKVMAAIDRLLPDSARDILVRMATKP